MPNPTIHSLLVAGLLTVSLCAGNDPFVGKWKLNPTKSKLTDRMKVEAAGPNKYAIDFGGGVETVVADGTDQPGLGGTTVSVTIEGPDAWKVVRKKDGRTLVTGTWTLSKDGQTLHDAFRANQQDGSILSLDYVYQRTEPGSGFVATWESTSEQVNSVIEFQIEPYEGGGLTFTTSGENQSLHVIFDGKDYPNVDAPAGSTYTARRLNERTLEITDKKQGKVTNTQQIEVSPDLKTLTETAHPADHGTPNILVFERE